MSVIEAKFLQPLLRDIRQHGADAAGVLALIQYMTALDGEHNGRRLIDGEMWWVATYAEIAEVIGVSSKTVGRLVCLVELKGALLSERPDAFKGDQTKAFRVPLHQQKDKLSLGSPAGGHFVPTPQDKMSRPPRTKCRHPPRTKCPSLFLL